MLGGIILRLFRVGLVVRGFRGVLFTGKLVKSIIINHIPDITSFLKPVKGGVPKLIHITPLYTTRDGRIRCIYSSYECSDYMVKCEGELKPISLNGEYYFYIGFDDRVIDYEKLFDNLMDLSGCIDFKDSNICYSISMLEYLDPYVKAWETVREVIRRGKVKIVFSSPTMLRDPFRRGKYKSLIPTVMNIFSTPIYIILYSRGIYTYKRFRRQILILHRLFSEPYSIIKTTNIKWVKYKHKPEPAITGYVNLYLNRDYMEYYGRYIDMEKYLGEIFATMITLGTGVGRAAGFGHIFIEPGK